ncbi:hypothetical protein NGM99_17160 [Mesorhizobium sp. RP14(2022)]|uniref:Uncharacterized protein n=1 Tax=Mesorhizobium liriopis TaxID=2953882 RepID=A0ABT1CC31_9HYPH|nr:hypothetical protein [Mesorhizobium liriopis]MCO6051516.1 hypothetical protein [Mesorhizobium liriopis]
MSSAKHRINSTGRKRLNLEKVDIRLLTVKHGQPLQATASLKLEDEGFDDDATVVIEAYHSSSGMRFDCGTVANLSIPTVMTLDEVDQGGNVLFRVKIIDSKVQGRLIASAERIQPRSDDDEEGRRSLFPIIERDLGSLSWKVDIEGDAAPALVLNSAVPGFKFRILENPLLQGVLLPAALRIVLEKIAQDPASEEGDWKEQWLEYCRHDLGNEDDPSELSAEDREIWVFELVERFCESKDFIGKIKKALEGDE